MNAIYKPFKSIDEIKAKGEFIKKGKIVPVRIARVIPKRNSHLLFTGSNQWAIPTRSGYLVFVENNDGLFDFVLTNPIKVKSCGHFYGATSNQGYNKKTTSKNPEIHGSTYHHNGGSKWLGNHELNEKDFLNKFNNNYLKMNS